MKALKNTAHVEGYVYEHKLETKVTGANSKAPGTEYITGSLSVATDDACLNVIPIHFTYVTATTSTGKTNSSFGTLQKFINGEYATVMGAGKDKAVKVRIDTAIALNEFYTDRNGAEELVSAKRYEGGFIHIVDALNPDEAVRNFFDVDMVITSAIRKEADPEKEQPEKMILKGAIFGFRKDLLPVEFTVTHPGAMDYFEDLQPSNKTPVFTWIKGKQISETVVKRIEEKSAFGDTFVREIPSVRKDYVITWASENTYEWDTEGTMTVEELNKAITDRELYLATLKKRNDEYKASKAAGTAAPAAAPTPANSAFNF